MRVHVDKEYGQLQLWGFEASAVFMALRDLHKALSYGDEDEAGPALRFDAGGLSYMLQDSEEDVAVLTIFRE